ncbi:MAG: T9SS type A sorting domain-containing protein, partial [Bacteroidota bacterium]
IYNGAILSKSISPVAIARSNQKIIIVANHSSDNLNSLDPNYFSSINVFDKTSVPLHNFDIELSKLLVDTAYYSVLSNTAYGNDFNLQLRLKFYVKNKSVNAINQFKFTCGTSFYTPSCDAGEFYQEKFENLNLLPGDSMQFTSGVITRFVSLDSQGYSCPGVPQEHCVYLTVPNNEVDKDQTNNEQCVFENFHNLGLKANVALAGQVFIYPNPVNRFLKIESQFEMKSIRISDYLGRNIQEMNADSKTIEVDTQALPKGIYFISVETESALITKKIIKE